ncbi:MAG: hypothetical protein IJ678_04425 [Kiritimatiellae bacterium]|nr:hypothetical protein [Kiritimatiellia bacterium]
MHSLIAVAHRVCPALSSNAACFPDKESMVRACSASMFRALRGLPCKVVAIMDSCPPAWEDFLRESFAPNAAEGSELVFERHDRAGNRATFARQIEVLREEALSADPPRYVFFSEDDYLYRPDAFRAMMAALDLPGAYFATPLDHPDRYGGAAAEPRASEIRCAGGVHWRRVGTTCLTFMCAPRTLLRTARALGVYCSGKEDAAAWLGITKEGMFSPRAMLRSLRAAAGRALRGPEKAGYRDFLPLYAWLTLGLRPLFVRRRSLWSPMPTLAVHCCANSLPPMADAILSGIR